MITEKVSIYPKFDEQLQVHVKNSIAVRCRAHGIPTPRVKWIAVQSGKEVGSNEDPSLFKIMNVVSSDRGDYMCLARNIVVNPPNGVVYYTDNTILKLRVDGMCFNVGLSLIIYTFIG